MGRIEKVNSQTLKFAKDSTKYIAPSWIELAQLTFVVAKKIIAGGEKVDRIVTLAKGGWPLTCSLVDYLRVEYVASFGVKFYTGINELLDKPIVYQDLPRDVSGEKILLFDDVADTGKSFVFAKKELEKQGAKRVITASMYRKPHSVFTPDYFAAETKAWIIFPYDVRETVGLLMAKWGKAGVTKTEMKRRFLLCGFKKEWVDYFVKLEGK